MPPRSPPARVSEIAFARNSAEAASAAATGAIPVTANPLHIGTKNAAAPAGDFFSGVIDEVRLYDRALSATEIAQLAQPILINFQLAGVSTPAAWKRPSLTMRSTA